MKNILLGIVRICSSLWRCNYPQTQKVFLNFSFHLWYIHQILNIFEEKMIMIANLFPRLQTVKSFVKALSKNCRFRTSFKSQHVKWSQTLVKSEWEISYHIFWELWEEMTWEISPLLNFEIWNLRGVCILFRIVRNWSSLFKWNYLKNKKLFVNFWLRLWNLHHTWNVFEKNMTVIGNVFPKLLIVKDLVKKLSKKHRFWTSFDSQLV